jgi:BirA family biotin operon repressor/biotin-[acetyl-CoA-carboxylase] ligase
MQQASMDLPRGYRLRFYEEIDSTNAEARRLMSAGEDGGLWIWAASQGAGRGRAGRSWASPAGNLYASLAIRPQVPLMTALQLSLLAGVAAHDALSGLAAGAGATAAALDLRLKWPNDVLLGTAKLGGILLESVSGPANEPPLIVIGTGLNLVRAPGDLGRPATSLANAGIAVTPAQAFAALAWSTAEWIARWEEGRGFPAIRDAWLDRAQPVGGPISVRLPGTQLSGTFLGIDEAGALRLSLASGEERRITAGDVAIGAGA